MRKNTQIATASVISLVLLAGCGGGSKGASSTFSGAQPAAPSSSAPSGGQRLQLSADPSGNLRFTKTSLTAKAGKVSIDFANGSSVAHNLTVQPASGGANLGATPTFSGGSKVLSLDLGPGKYTFFCSVPGHRQAGMQGTLVVK